MYYLLIACVVLPEALRKRIADDFQLCHPLILVGRYRRKRCLGEYKPLIVTVRHCCGSSTSGIRSDLWLIRFGRQVDNVETWLVAMHRIENDLAGEKTHSFVYNIIIW